MGINWEEQLGNETDHATQGSSVGKDSLKTSGCKNLAVGVVVVGETTCHTGEFFAETHRVLECTQTHPLRNQHQKGPICLWVMGEVTENWPRAEQTALFPLDPSPTYSAMGCPMLSNT